MSFGFGLGLPHWYTLAGGFTPASLFGPGQIGVWYNPNDPLTLFTTSDGTTQCATPGSGSQVLVGLMLDKSQNGVGTNGAKRVNVLAYTEQFDNAYWVKSGLNAFGSGSVANTTATLDPLGGNTADYIQENTANTAHVAYPNGARTVTTSALYVATVYAKAAQRNFVNLTFGSYSTTNRYSSATYELVGAGAVTKTRTAGASTLSATSITAEGNGWYRINLIASLNTGTDGYFGVSVSNLADPTIDSVGDPIYTGNGTSGVYIWGADLRLASEAATPPTYQRITDTWYATMAGNHAIAFNNTDRRPELSARVNLLTYSEEFQNAAWTKVRSTVSNNATIAPDGTSTADAWLETATTGAHAIEAPPLANIVNTPYTHSVCAKANGRNWLRINFYTNFVDNNTWFDLQNGVVGTNASGNSASIQSLGNGWFRCSVTRTAVSGPLNANFYSLAIADADNSSSYAGDITKGLFIWGADLRVSGLAPTVPTYQRIADQYTYNASGFPRYLIADGSNDSMYTPATIPFATVTSDGLARRNLLTLPTQFNVSPPWTIAAGVTVTANVDTAPDGTLSADRILFTGISQDVQQEPTLANAQYVASYYVKAGNAGEIGKTIAIGIGNPTNGFTDALITLTADWQRITATRNINSGTTCRIGVHTYAGATARNVIVWGAQLETGSTATAFQNIGTDNMSVFTGLRRLSDAAQGMVVEYSATTASNNGSFSLETPSVAAGSDFQFISKGTVANTINADNYPAPLSAILSDRASISPASNNIRVSGLEVDDDLGTQGTGVYGTYQLFLFARNNASAYFNGYLYQLIVRGAATSETQTKQVENWLSSNTGIALDTTPVYDYVVLDNGDFVVDDYGNNVFIEVT